MKKKSTTYSLEILSPWSLFFPKELEGIVRQHCEMLPEYLPMKFGWSEPLKEEFDPNNLLALVPPDGPILEKWKRLNRNLPIPGPCERTIWKRTGRHRAWGVWSPRQECINGFALEEGVVRPVPDCMETHSRVFMSFHETSEQLKLLAYLKAASIFTEADYGFMDGLTEQYKPYAIQNDSSPFGGDLGASIYDWIPDMFWATVFGPAYVRMFGKEKLMSVPAHLVESLGDEMVFIQLTPRMEDVDENFEEVMQIRERVKQHLGGDTYFYSPAKGYDRRPSVADKKAFAEATNKRGKVFRVPDFELRPVTK